MKYYLRLLALPALSLLAACEGTVTVDPTGSDSGVVPTRVEVCASGANCGGDVVGSWQVSSSCVNEWVTSISPCGGPQVAEDLGVTGTFAAKSDMTYSMAFTMSGRGRECVPASAVSPPSGPAACADFQESRENNLLAQSSSASVTCETLQDGGCDCAVSYFGWSATGSGTYTTGAHLTLTPGSGSLLTSRSILANEYTYCVEGNHLTLSPTSTGTQLDAVTFGGWINFDAQ
jgi:hypothetical protein